MLFPFLRAKATRSPAVVITDRRINIHHRQAPRFALADPRDLRAAVALVFQETFLFADTVLENLTLGQPVDPDRLQWAIDIAQAGYVDDLAEGRRTVVGERGVTLSGGQRQRLAVARALLRQAPVLLLDEATSALDSDSELAVQRALLRLAGGRTVLAVAHRLSTVVEFDRVIVLHEGRIAEDGRPSELLRAGTGHFARAWRLQQRPALGVERAV